MNFKSLRRVLGTVVAVAVLVFSTVISAAPAMADVTVGMGTTGMLAFSPDAIMVSPGDTIIFEMGQLGPHNIEFEGALASVSAKNLMFAPGETAAVTIPADTPAGTYNFYCDPHRGAGMVGTVTVQ
ncbi:MAG: plastocyanin [Merismopedia sp. SIO2A8]|nr:plastocyanin [Merismopedia sp. SIO2A8]